MSRKLPKEEYDKTLSGKFEKWLSGSEDPYVGHVEMQKQSIDPEYEKLKKQNLKEKICLLFLKRNWMIYAARISA